jgi:tRNA nucleotidyltransferase/poly(A) polymerase
LLNLTSLMDSWLNTTQLSFLRKISHISQKTGIESYLVGGTVRDILLGRVPLDIDLAVVGNFSQLKSNFAELLGG